MGEGGAEQRANGRACRIGEAMGERHATVRDAEEDESRVGAVALELPMPGLPTLWTLVLIGGWLQKRVALWRIRLVSAAVLAALAAWTLVEFIQA